MRNTIEKQEKVDLFYMQLIFIGLGLLTILMRGI